MDPKPNQPFDAATTVEHSAEATVQLRSPRPLIVDPVMLDGMMAHLRDWLPNEGCGLLAAIPEWDADRAAHFFPGTNIDRSPVRFTMDPVEVIAAMKRMRDEHWELAAIVHSHPRTQPAPSRTDQNEWYYPEARLLIVSFAGEEPEIGCWALTGDQMAREFRASQLLVAGR
ncbi:MAG: M67 family metallopeptidase [Nocardioides sp.]